MADEQCFVCRDDGCVRGGEPADLPGTCDEAGCAIDGPDGVRLELSLYADDVAGVLGDLEGDANVALGPQIVDLVWLQVVEQFDHLHRIGQVAVVEEKLHPVDMGILVKLVDTVGVERIS